MTANAGDLSSLNESLQIDGFDDYAAHVAGTNVVGYNCGKSSLAFLSRQSCSRSLVAALALLLYDILLTAQEEVRLLKPYLHPSLTRCFRFR